MPPQRLPNRSLRPGRFNLALADTLPDGPASLVCWAGGVWFVATVI
jgi:hypothetical protein